MCMTLARFIDSLHFFNSLEHELVSYRAFTPFDSFNDRLDEIINLIFIRRDFTVYLDVLCVFVVIAAHYFTGATACSIIFIFKCKGRVRFKVFTGWWNFLDVCHKRLWKLLIKAFELRCASLLWHVNCLRTVVT